MTENRIEPIDDKKRTIAALVQERIRAAILNGILPPGSRIDQNQLASDLNVSLVPVREALQKLEAEGFVQILPRRGAFVTETSISDMEDLYFARRILEGQAAYYAAEQLTDAQIAELERLLKAMDVDLAAHNYSAFMSHNRQFHFTIYQAANSRYLMNLIAGLWDLAERYRFRYMFVKDQAAKTQAEHQAILEACRARDKEKLRDAILFHMTQTLIGIRAYLTAEAAPETV